MGCFIAVRIFPCREFGDYHTTAVDETWYKMAILQHQIDPKSFVYSVDIPPYLPGSTEYVVTASHAIFPRDGGIEAPGSVVGFQFSHELMRERFMEITSKVNVSELDGGREAAARRWMITANRMWMCAFSATAA